MYGNMYKKAYISAHVSKFQLYQYNTYWMKSRKWLPALAIYSCSLSIGSYRVCAVKCIKYFLLLIYRNNSFVKKEFLKNVKLRPISCLVNLSGTIFLYFLKKLGFLCHIMLKFATKVQGNTNKKFCILEKECVKALLSYFWSICSFKQKFCSPLCNESRCGTGSIFIIWIASCNV